MKKRLRKIIYLLGFFIAIQSALPAYINSSFIEQYLQSDKFIGLLYAVGSIISIICLSLIPILLRKIGNFLTIIYLTIANIISLLVLSFSSNGNLILFFFTAYLVLQTIIYYNLDIFLENQSEDKNTGNIRGVYFTAINIAWVISPFLAGTLLNGGNYWKIYLIAGSALIPFIILLSLNFKNFKDRIYTKTPFWETLKKIFKMKHLYKIFMIRSFLQFFYAWMVIYTPIYLHKYIGLDWKTIGIIFTIMLLPFVLFQLPLGILADRKFGEKEILNIGIIIIAFSTMILSFTETTAFWIWAIILFTTRVGASAVNIMSESYFFKNVNDSNANIISFFRMTGPIAYTIAPLLASFLLLFIKFQFIFLILGLIMLFSLKYSLTLKDTK